MPKKIRKHHLLDYWILVPYVLLCIIGLIMVYSSTSYDLISNGASQAASVINQLAFWILSLIVIAIMFKMKTKVLKNKRLIQFLALFVFVLLFITLVFAKPINGAKGWLAIGPVTLQPAEYLKILAIWYLSVVLGERQKLIQSDFFKTIWKSMVWIIAMILMVAVQPDFGNAAIIVLLACVVLLAGGLNWMYAAIIGGAGVGASVIVIELIAHFGNNMPGRLHYIYERFQSFQNPFKYELDQGHQLVNGYYAMFNGGLFGRGLGNSIQKKGFLSEAQTDFIFAIVTEELGLIGAMLILLLLFFLIGRIFLIGIRSNKPFNSMMCIGIGSLFLLQVFINLGGITGIIPLTGITFPFISLGGNSLLVLSVAIAFVLNISADERRQKYQL